MSPATRTLYALSGLPFSGKTTAARHLANDNALVISRDRILEEFNRRPELIKTAQELAADIEEPVSRLAPTREANAFNDVITRLYCREVLDRIEATAARTVIVDGTNLHPLARAFVTGLDGWHRVAIIVEAALETCVERLRQAETKGVRRTVTPDLIRRMATIFERPALEEGFDEIRIV